MLWKNAIQKYWLLVLFVGTNFFEKNKLISTLIIIKKCSPQKLLWSKIKKWRKKKYIIKVKEKNIQNKNMLYSNVNCCQKENSFQKLPVFN